MAAGANTTDPTITAAAIPNRATRANMFTPISIDTPSESIAFGAKRREGCQLLADHVYRSIVLGNFRCQDPENITQPGRAGPGQIERRIND